MIKSSRQIWRSLIEPSIKCVNEGTLLVQGLYTTFFIIAISGFAITWGTTHKQLFLNELVNISIGQSISIPVSTFYVVFPVLLVFLHFQLLWQMLFAAERIFQVAGT
jgi:hypothetical protein